MTHTPGPWNTRVYAQSAEKIKQMREHNMEPTRLLDNDGGMPIMAGDVRIGTAHLTRDDVKRGERWNAEDEERDANGFLMAAANRMLKTLDWIADRPDPDGDMDESDLLAELQTIIDRARETSAAATGE